MGAIQPNVPSCNHLAHFKDNGTETDTHHHGAGDEQALIFISHCYEIQCISNDPQHAHQEDVVPEDTEEQEKTDIVRE